MLYVLGSASGTLTFVLTVAVTNSSMSSDLSNHSVVARLDDVTLTRVDCVPAIDPSTETGSSTTMESTTATDSSTVMVIDSTSAMATVTDSSPTAEASTSTRGGKGVKGGRGGREERSWGRSGRGGQGTVRGGEKEWLERPRPSRREGRRTRRRQEAKEGRTFKKMMKIMC